MTRRFQVEKSLSLKDCSQKNLLFEFSSMPAIYDIFAILLRLLQLEAALVAFLFHHQLDVWYARLQAHPAVPTLLPTPWFALPATHHALDVPSASWRPIWYSWPYIWHAISSFEALEPSHRWWCTSCPKNHPASPTSQVTYKLQLEGRLKWTSPYPCLCFWRVGNFWLNWDWDTLKYWTADTVIDHSRSLWIGIVQVWYRWPYPDTLTLDLKFPLVCSVDTWFGSWRPGGPLTPYFVYYFLWQAEQDYLLCKQAVETQRRTQWCNRVADMMIMARSAPGISSESNNTWAWYKCCPSSPDKMRSLHRHNHAEGSKFHAQDL